MSARPRGSSRRQLHGPPIRYRGRAAGRPSVPGPPPICRRCLGELSPPPGARLRPRAVRADQPECAAPWPSRLAGETRQAGASPPDRADYPRAVLPFPSRSKPRPHIRSSWLITRESTFYFYGLIGPLVPVTKSNRFSAESNRQPAGGNFCKKVPACGIKPSSVRSIGVPAAGAWAPAAGPSGPVRSGAGASISFKRGGKT
jgi:hypothetical protein